MPRDKGKKKPNSCQPLEMIRRNTNEPNVFATKKRTRVGAQSGCCMLAVRKLVTPSAPHQSRPDAFPKYQEKRQF
jgi:hypothetical protein